MRARWHACRDAGKVWARIQHKALMKSSHDKSLPSLARAVTLCHTLRQFKSESNFIFKHAFGGRNIFKNYKNVAAAAHPANSGNLRQNFAIENAPNGLSIFTLLLRIL
jgi:hypothetical protein